MFVFAWLSSVLVGWFVRDRMASATGRSLAKLANLRSDRGEGSQLHLVNAWNVLTGTELDVCIELPLREPNLLVVGAMPLATSVISCQYVISQWPLPLLLPNSVAYIQPQC